MFTVIISSKPTGLFIRILLQDLVVTVAERYKAKFFSKTSKNLFLSSVFIRSFFQASLFLLPTQTIWKETTFLETMIV